MAVYLLGKKKTRAAVSLCMEAFFFYFPLRMQAKLA